MDSEDMIARRRHAMVEQQIAARGVSDPEVLAAMRTVPRHRFVPAGLVQEAHDDCALPLEHGQAISQPYVVAFMTEQLRLQPGARVLEVGTGCGYQTAVLCELGAEVYSVEIIAGLARAAEHTLLALGYSAQLRVGDGALGWPEQAPFDAILLTAAPRQVPQALVEQLAQGGRLLVPVGEPGETQQLQLLEKRGQAVSSHDLLQVRFVPMTGRG